MSTGGEPISYGKQLSDSLDSFLFGCFLFVLTSVAIWQIEAQAVKFALILSRAHTACRALKNIDVVNQNFEKRCICVKGESSVKGDISKANCDTDTGFVAPTITKQRNVIRLKRSVEMYQWIEHEHREKKKGHTDKVTYSYTLTWSDIYHNSSNFHNNGSPYSGNNHHGGGSTSDIHYSDRSHITHYNPPKNPNFDSNTINASEVYVGAYHLSDAQVCMMNEFERVDLNSCPFTPNDVKMKQSSNATIQSRDGISYLVYKPLSIANANADINNPEPGLVRISYESLYEKGKVTTIGVLKGDTFRPFTEKDAHGTLGDHHQWLGSYCNCNNNNDKSGKKSLLHNDTDYGSDDENIDDDNDNNGGCCCSLCESIPCCKLLSFCIPLMNKCIAFVVGNDVLLLEEKHFSISSMFQHADDGFHYRLRICRIIAVLLFWASISMIFSPVSTLLSFIPFIGGFASGLFGILTFILAMILCFVIFAVSWTLFHPEYLTVAMLGIGIPCWVSTTASSAWVTFGGICSILSIIPFGLYLLNWREDCKYADEQERLDEEMSNSFPNGNGNGNGVGNVMNENTSLVNSNLNQV